MRTVFTLSMLMAIAVSFAQLPGSPDNEYKKEIDLWHQNRIESLKSESGWLNIVGLYWLKEGENTFGSSKENDVIFPEKKANAKLGSFFLKEGVVTLKTLPGNNIQSNNQPFDEGVIYSDKQEKPIVLAHDKLKWFIIKRGNKYGVRLRDMESVSLKQFTHIDRFPTDKKWRVIATYKAPPEPSSVIINDIIGLATATPFGGTLHFEIDGKHFQLDATLEDDDLFIVFADETTGNETYGGGRFLYAKKPLPGNTVVVDFNKAYNPPCCFTNFATCPLPMAQNRLDIAILAGEKTYEHH